LRLCFVVNNPRTQRPTYTTLHVAYEAHRRGHEVRFVSSLGLSLGDDGRVWGQARFVPRGAAEDAAAAYCAALVGDGASGERLALEDSDVVLLRNNPNVGELPPGGVRRNPALDFARLVKGRTLVVNDPDGLRRAGSKMYLAGFPAAVRPRTLVTRSAARIKEFLRDLDGPAILKPLAGYGGKNVFYVRRGQVANLNPMIATLREEGYIIAQEYLPEAARGDMRILLLGGEPIRAGGHVAAYRRMRPKDDIRNNMHVGGVRKRCDFGEVEERLARLIKPRLDADGLFFVGIDVVGDKLLEVNVFAPGGVHNINELYGVNVGARVVDELELRAARRGYEGGLATGSIR
jgi:glutathione synthase